MGKSLLGRKCDFTCETVLKKTILISLFLLLALNFQGQTTVSQNEEVHEFDFLDTDQLNHTLSDFSEKPILLEWGASWCGVCKLNQNNMKTIYGDYKANVTFITISYGGSGDDIDDVQWMKDRGPFDWLFGLDIDNYALDVGAANGHMWILNADRTIYQRWGKSVVGIGDLQTKLNEVIGPIVSESASETTITTQTTTTFETTFISDGSTITQTTEQEITTEFVDTIVETLTLDPEKVENPISSFGLEDNPFFIGFILVSAIAVGLRIFSRIQI